MNGDDEGSGVESDSSFDDGVDESGDTDEGSGTPSGDTTVGLPDESKPLLSSEDILKRGRELALRGLPLQLSNLLDAIAQLRARATGSTAEIFPSIMGQLDTLRSQYGDASQALARRLGFAGGGQTVRAQQGMLGQATKQVAGLIGQSQQASFANLIRTLGGLQPALSGAARPPSITTKSSPFDATNQGTGLAAILSTAKELQAYSANQPKTGVQPYSTLPAASEELLFGVNPGVQPAVDWPL